MLSFVWSHNSISFWGMKHTWLLNRSYIDICKVKKWNSSHILVVGIVLILVILEMKEFVNWAKGQKLIHLYRKFLLIFAHQISYWNRCREITDKGIMKLGNAFWTLKSLQKVDLCVLHWDSQALLLKESHLKLT